MTPAKLIVSIGRSTWTARELEWAKRLLDATAPYLPRTRWAGMVKRCARRLWDDQEALTAFDSAWRLGGKKAARALAWQLGSEDPPKVGPEERARRARESVDAAVAKRARRAEATLAARREKIAALEGELKRLRAQEKTWAMRVRRYQERGTVKAYRYRCSARASTFSCDSGESKPHREKCSYCGTKLVIEEGMWGVFAWEAANLYRAESALATYVVKGAAERRAEKIDGAVVRFIPDRPKEEACDSKRSDPRSAK